MRRKNRTQKAGQNNLLIDRKSPSRGHRHVVTKADILCFIELIPDWERLSDGLEKIVLSPGATDYDGLYESFHNDDTGAIYLSAWNEDLWMPLYRSYFDEHCTILSHLGVAHDPPAPERDTVDVRFTEPQARAFVLLHVFLHELGHHYHQRKLRHKNSRLDENFAESFANRRAEEMLSRYREVFGDPAGS